MTLKEELEILRGEPIEVFTGDPMDIPCIETSDAEKLCKHPVVSVSMITYNHEPYIRQAIEGVMMQKTDFEFELVIGEDCSQDKTREICFEYQKKYPDKIRVLWWHENVSKLGGNGRRTRAHCRGEFIALCEGDDYWIDPLKLQKQVDVMRKYPNVGICFCGAVDFHQTTGVSENYDIANDIPVGVISGRDFLAMNIFGRGKPLQFGREAYVRTATVMFRTSAWHEALQKNDILLWRLRLGDVPFWLSLASVANVYYIPDQVATYRMDPKGLCVQRGNVLWKDNLLSRIYFLLTQYTDGDFQSRQLSLLQKNYVNSVLYPKDRVINSYIRYVLQLLRMKKVRIFVNFKMLFFIFLHYLRYDCTMLKPVGKFYRRILGHEEISMKKVAHVFWDYAPQLSGPLAKKVTSIDPSAVIFLRDIGACADKQDAMSRNKRWIDELPQGRYQGYLQRSLLHGLTKHFKYVGVLLSIFGFGFSVRSVWRMLMGPKYWVFHGMMIPLGLIVLMRLVGKRIVLIHWGGHMISFAGKRARVFYVASLRLLNHMFVLMEPEAVFYRKWLPNDKVSTLPYYVDTKMWQDEFAEYDHDGQPIRKVILGPNAWSLELYDKILDRMPVGSWDKIICLLSTVRENEKEKIDQFVAKYAGKFGSSFYAWREVVPYAKYLEFVNQTPYYLSPITTQSGLGAIAISIRMGKTIFLDGDNYDWIRSLGVKVFSSSSLKDYSYEELSRSRLTFDERIVNKNVFRDYYTNTINEKVWFESIRKALGIL